MRIEKRNRWHESQKEVSIARINKGGIIMHELQNSRNISATVQQVINGNNILESLHENIK